MKRLIVIDTETTGLFEDGEPEPRVVEVAAVELALGRGKAWEVGSFLHTLVNPGIAIPATARAVHHISDADVKKAPLLREVLLGPWGLFVRGEQKAAHNAAYDARLFPSGPQWICTWRCARHVWPDLPSHGNQVIRYTVPGVAEAIEGYLAALPKKVRDLPPHRALPDAVVTAHVLLALLRERGAEELLDLTQAPILERTIRFGMHRGTPWAEVPASYLQWILRQNEANPDAWDRDVVHTAEHHYRSHR